MTLNTDTGEFFDVCYWIEDPKVENIYNDESKLGGTQFYGGT